MLRGKPRETNGALVGGKLADSTWRTGLVIQVGACAHHLQRPVSEIPERYLVIVALSKFHISVLLCFRFKEPPLSRNVNLLVSTQLDGEIPSESHEQREKP